MHYLFYTFLLGAYEEGYLSVPVWFTAAPQDAESVQRNGVQNMDAGVAPVQYQQRFRVFGTGQSLWNRGMGEWGMNLLVW